MRWRAWSLPQTARVPRWRYGPDARALARGQLARIDDPPHGIRVARLQVVEEVPARHPVVALRLQQVDRHVRERLRRPNDEVALLRLHLAALGAHPEHRLEALLVA